MSTTEQAMVVAVFTDSASAERAVAALQQAGFSDNQIRFSGHGANGGGMLSSLKAFFTGEGTNTSAYDNLTGLGMPDRDASFYQNEYESGRDVVAVMGGSNLPKAANIMASYGGYGTGTRRDTAQIGADYSDSTGTESATGADTTSQDAQRLQLREEQLQVYKQPVQTGEVNLRKEVVTEQKNIEVPVSREEVVIERRPVSGQVSDAPIGEDETIRIPVSEEQVSVSKQTVATGEVAVGKRQVQGTQQVSDTVRREEARLERRGETNVTNSGVEETSEQLDSPDR